MANINLTQEKQQALRSGYKHRNSKGKYPRQKMLPEYRDIYPWVLPDEIDPYFAFCTLCECRLSAKRSDLGKHEYSIKHTAAKKAFDKSLKGCTENANSSAFNHAEEESDEDAPYIKNEPELIDLIEHSNGALKLEELNQQTSGSAHLRFPSNIVIDDDDDEVDGEENEDENSSYSMPTKRRCSETDSQSQHSSTLDFLPVHVTINEANTVQRFSIREIPAFGSYTSPTITNSPPTISTPPIRYSSQPTGISNTPQTPCKITIKKITHPLTPATLSQVTSTATITAVPAPITMSPQSQQAPRVTALQTPQANPTPFSVSVMPQATTAPPIVRDSFELFFDSICSSVKSLPPMLATEGKIRVMQLIGELEMRAITEREQQSTGGVRCGTGSEGQQIATVASTTK